jgi:hypothetical protein
MFGFLLLGGAFTCIVSRPQSDFRNFHVRSAPKQQKEAQPIVYQDLVLQDSSVAGHPVLSHWGKTLFANFYE